MKVRARLILATVAALGAAAVVAFFLVIPHEVDRRRNAWGPATADEKPRTVPALHQDLRIVDLHADTLLWDRDLLDVGHRGHVDLPRLQQGNVALQVFSIVTKSPRNLNVQRNAADSDNITLLAIAQRWPAPTWSSLSERALYQARRLDDAVHRSNGQLRSLRTRDDVESLLRARETDHEIVGALLAVEGAHALEGDLAKLADLEAAGVRMIAPTHLFDSEWGGAQAGLSHGGLTDAGRAWVQEMDRRELIIDLAHASSKTIDDVLALTKRPVVVSHTGLKAICETNRNLDDDQVRRIAAQGGLIGIGLWDEVMCGPGLERVGRTLRHAIEIAGVEHVALGSDWDGFVRTAIDAAHVGWLTAVLQEQGFSEAELRAVMGENALAFLRANLPAAVR